MAMAILLMKYPMKKDINETVAVKLLWVAKVQDPETIMQSDPPVMPLRKQRALVMSLFTTGSSSLS